MPDKLRAFVLCPYKTRLAPTYRLMALPSHMHAAQTPLPARAAVPLGLVSKTQTDVLNEYR